MSIETAIQNAQIRVEACYTQVSTQGGTIPTTKNLANLPQAISTISGGGIPNYIAPKNNVNGVYKADNTATSFSLNGATDVDRYALTYAFYNCTNLTSADLSSLTTISGIYAMSYCFYGCTGLTSVALPFLTTVSAGNAMYYCFSGCTNLTSADLSSLTTVSGSTAMQYCFSGCAGITSVNLSSLTTVSGTNTMSSCFQNCTKLTELRFPALQSFGTNTSVVSQFSNMLSGVTGCTLHFPSNMQSEVERRSGYPNFGGTNTVVLFDLPATA